MSFNNPKSYAAVLATMLASTIPAAPATAGQDECLAIIGMVSDSVCETGFCGALSSNRGHATVESVVDESQANPVKVQPNGTQKVKILQTITFTDGDLAGLSYVTSNRFTCRVLDQSNPGVCRASSRMNVVDDGRGLWGRFDSLGFGDFSELPYMEWFYEGQICGL